MTGERRTAIELRDLTTLGEIEGVVELQKAIWGYGSREDLVPAPVMAVTVLRGAILVGALDQGRLVGFVYSLPAIHQGRLSHWSHMLGVVATHRQCGAGRDLKLAQRQRALALGVDLIEWTFDPLQVQNAHLNVARLGAIVEEYVDNVYGASSSPLHGELPTDRFIAQWWIGRPHVERRIAPPGALRVVSHGAVQAPTVNELRPGGEWPACGLANLSLDVERIQVLVPAGFTEMLAAAPALALDWRLRTREIFTAYLRRGYRVVDFLFDRQSGVGRYVLASAARDSAPPG